MRVLVTGGAGFIGSNFVHYLLNQYDDIEIVTLDALTYAGSRTNLNGVLDDPRHDLVEGDIRDRELVTELVGGIDAVVNFAAESHVDRSIDGARPFVEANVAGTQPLLDADTEAGIERFLPISTDEVYGQILDGEFTEADRLQLRNPYAATKASADLLAQSYATTHDLPVVITRTCNNFGPRQHAEKHIPNSSRAPRKKKPSLSTVMGQTSGNGSTWKTTAGHSTSSCVRVRLVKSITSVAVTNGRILRSHEPSSTPLVQTTT